MSDDAPVKLSKPGPKGCWYPNRDGEPCGMSVLKDSDGCWQHDPTNQKARQAAKSKGGRRAAARHSGPAPDVDLSVKGAGALLSYGVRELLYQPNTLQRAQAIREFSLAMLKVAEAGGPKDPIAEVWNRYQTTGELPEDEEKRQFIATYETTLRLMREQTQPEEGDNDGE